jgi:hemoglobin
MFKRLKDVVAPSSNARDAEIAMELEKTITEASIRRMVDTFYDSVRKDDMLGPVFENALHGQWESHMPRMYDFWSTVLLGSGRFQGNVFGKHMALPGITKEHFVRWLGLFNATITQMYDEDTAQPILEVAGRIAESLQFGFFGERRVLPGRG